MEGRVDGPWMGLLGYNIYYNLNNMPNLSICQVCLYINVFFKITRDDLLPMLIDE